jgi:hypothetical protein
MTQGQKDNIKRLKAVQLEAKKLKAKNPKLKHVDAVKKAFAMFSTGVKKTAKKKSAKKKVGAVKIVQKDKNEKVTKVLKQIRTKKTGQFKGYKQITGVKKKKVFGRTGTAHKDSKSHNVNIRVVSGIGKMQSDSINKYKEIIKDIAHYEDAIKRIKSGMQGMTSPEKVRSKLILKKMISIKNELKTHAIQIKKHI